MNPEEYARLRALEDWYWWFVARRAAAIRFLGAYAPKVTPLHVLEVGCGTGGMLRDLGALPDVEAVGVDVSLQALRLCQAPHARGLVLASAERLPFSDCRFHAVTALDVIEHVTDDGAAAREIARVLRPGGVAIVTVPAYQWLWSRHDDALHHRRRYHARQLRDLLTDAGLEVAWLTALIAALFPVAAAMRLAQRLAPISHVPRAEIVPVPRPLNRLLVAFHRWEAALAQYVRLP